MELFQSVFAEVFLFFIFYFLFPSPQIDSAVGFGLNSVALAGVLSFADWIRQVLLTSTGVQVSCGRELLVLSILSCCFLVHVGDMSFLVSIFLRRCGIEHVSWGVVCRIHRLQEACCFTYFVTEKWASLCFLCLLRMVVCTAIFENCRLRMHRDSMSSN